MTLNRRDLLISGSGVAALAASNVASVNFASAQATVVPTTWDREANVVVIGSGERTYSRDRRPRNRFVSHRA